MEMQLFIPTDNFDCDENLFGYETCVFERTSNMAHCKLPFQNWSMYQDLQNRLCNTIAEGYASFRQFQLTPTNCKVPCTQLSIDFNYYIPQYLRAKYLSNAKKPSNIIAYYLHLPRAIKVTKASPSYGFITFVAEVSGWYNLFLGGSVFAMWAVLVTKILMALAKVQEQLSQLLSPLRNIPYLLVAGCSLIYIFIDCITILILSPVGSNTLFTNSVPKGLCLSICLPQYTTVYTENIKSEIFPFSDAANSTEYWVYGNDLRNKIFDLSVILEGGEVLTIWNMIKSTTAIQSTNFFHISNIVSNDIFVDFCHTVDLSKLPGHMNGIRVKAVNDITLVVHLAGQLLSSQTKYVVGNRETTQQLNDKIFLYNSEIKIELEETSFQNISTQSCKNYNSTWTYDSCVMDYGIMQLQGNTELLKKLLLPNSNSTVQQGIEQTVLQRLYVALQSQNECLPDCRSLVVNMRVETSPNRAQPMRGISPPPNMFPLPLPPLLVEVNITVPDLSKLNQVFILLINEIVQSNCLHRRK